MGVSWPKVKLGEVLRLDLTKVPVDASTVFPMVGVLSYGKGLFDREPIENGKTSYKYFCRLKADHIVMSQLFGWEGALALCSPAFAGKYVSPQFPTFMCDDERLNRDFLGWLMRRPAFWDELGTRAVGMGDRRRTLNPAALFACEIPLPPLTEQRRIVARIEELAGKIEEARRLRRDAVEEGEALLRGAIGCVFSQMLTTNEPKSFEQFSPHVTSGPRNWAKHYGKTDFRFYRAQDIGSHGKILDASKVFITPPSGTQGRTAMPQVGDLLIVITGATVGRVAVFNDNHEAGFVNQHVAICRLPKNEVEPEYALWGLRGPEGQNQLLGRCYGQGKPGLNLSNIRALSLPFPSLLEQRRIVTYLDSLQAKVDVLKALHAETTTELAALLPAILDRAFKGELG